MFPLDSLKRVYICNYSAVIYSFSNHHRGIEPCDDYIVNVDKFQIYYVYLSSYQIEDKYFYQQSAENKKNY